MRPRGKWLQRHRSPVPAVGGAELQRPSYPGCQLAKWSCAGCPGPLGGPGLCAILKGLQSSKREGTLAGRMSRGTGPRGHSCAHRGGRQYQELRAGWCCLPLRSGKVAPEGTSKEQDLERAVCARIPEAEGGCAQSDCCLRGVVASQIAEAHVVSLSVPWFPCLQNGDEVPPSQAGCGELVCGGWTECVS